MARTSHLLFLTHLLTSMGVFAQESQNSVYTMYIFNATQTDNVYASVVSANPSETVLQLNCNDADCDMFGNAKLTTRPGGHNMAVSISTVYPGTFVNGSSTSTYNITSSVSGTISCSNLPVTTTTSTSTLSGSSATSVLPDQAYCTGTARQVVDSFRDASFGGQGWDYTLSSIDSSAVPVTITAGLDKLPTPTTTTTSTTSSSTGGAMPMITGNAQAALMGVGIAALVNYGMA
ncbi:hypothetical protein B0H66DRAFT_549902 [Apodospora peruviana]|uniref:Uncharacterized protein n=1 Tax=Apodospora peruviana TaxID=516989 RepID=A0AAE0MB45_9PEZI|nr:hypothetical protein B0H66DRAFT_549902 [Apodospora peruviana]